MRGDTVKDIAVKRCPECGARFAETAGFCPFDGMSLAASSLDPNRDPLVGTLIDARYEVERLLGEGGMGSVYEVRHVKLDRRFALKALKRELASDESLAERFLREAKATAAIKHPGVVQITDFGKLGSGEPFFVMERLEGETLATRIRARGPMSPRAVVGIARQICSALEASHTAGVIHRDLKPENVFLVGKSEDVRIVDFGAAKIMGSSKMTRPGVVFGTPYYMSPEQASGGEVDARADIYSLGVLMYEMITGSVPFEADTYMGVLTKHMFAEPTKPSARVASGVQLGDLENVVMRALSKDPDVRYPTMRDLAEALATALERRASDTPPKEVGRAAPSLTTADRIERTVARQVGEERKRIVQRVTLAVMGVISVGLFVVALVLWLSPSPRAVHTESAMPPPPSSPAMPPTTPTPTALPTVTAAAPTETTATATVDVPPPPPPVPSPIVTSTVAAPPPTPKKPLPPPPPPTTRPKGPDAFDDPWLK